MFADLALSSFCLHTDHLTICTASQHLSHIPSISTWVFLGFSRVVLGVNECVNMCMNGVL